MKITLKEYIQAHDLNFNTELLKYNTAKDRVYDLLIERIEILARLYLTDNPKLKEFIMAMGTCFFTYKRGNETAHDIECPEIEAILSEYNEVFKLTGEPMRFTAKGKKITDW